MEQTEIFYNVMGYDEDGLCITHHFDNINEANMQYNKMVGEVEDKEYIIMTKTVIETCSTTMLDSRK